MSPQSGTVFLPRSMFSPEPANRKATSKSQPQSAKRRGIEAVGGVVFDDRHTAVALDLPDRPAEAAPLSLLAHVAQPCLTGRRTGGAVAPISPRNPELAYKDRLAVDAVPARPGRNRFQVGGDPLA